MERPPRPPMERPCAVIGPEPMAHQSPPPPHYRKLYPPTSYQQYHQHHHHHLQRPYAAPAQPSYAAPPRRVQPYPYYPQQVYAANNAAAAAAYPHPNAYRVPPTAYPHPHHPQYPQPTQPVYHRYPEYQYQYPTAPAAVVPPTRQYYQPQPSYPKPYPIPEATSYDDLYARASQQYRYVPQPSPVVDPYRVQERTDLRRTSPYVKCCEWDPKYAPTPPEVIQYARHYQQPAPAPAPAPVLVPPKIAYEPCALAPPPPPQQPPRPRPVPPAERPAMDLRRYLENWDEEYEDLVVAPEPQKVEQPANDIIRIAQPPVRFDGYVSDFIDVEAKISQSIIHKEVGCNFEIRPCTPAVRMAMAGAGVAQSLDPYERRIDKEKRISSPRSEFGFRDNGSKVVRGVNDSFPNMSSVPDNRAAVGVVLNVGVSNPTNAYDTRDSCLRTPEYLESVIRQPPVENAYQVPSTFGGVLDSKLTSTPLSTETCHDLSMYSRKPDAIVSELENAVDFSRENTRIASEIDMEKILNLDQDPISYCQDNKVNPMDDIQSDILDYSSMKLSKSPCNSAAVLQNDLDQTADVKKDDVTDYCELPVTDPELPKVVEEHNKLSTLDHHESEAPKKRHSHGKMFFSKKLNRYEYSFESSLDSVDDLDKDVDNEEFPIFPHLETVEETVDETAEHSHAFHKAPHTPEDKDVTKDAPLQQDEPKMLDTNENILGPSDATDVCIESDDCKLVLKSPSTSIHDCPEFKTIMCDSEKLFEIDVDPSADGEVILRHENIFTDHIEIENSNLDVREVVDMKPNLDHKESQVGSVNDVCLNMPESEDETCARDPYSPKEKSIKYETYLMEDSLSDDNYKSYNSVMLCGDQMSEGSTDDDSELSSMRDKIENSNLDINGLEMSGIWIDDIACVETVISEDNAQIDNSQESWKDYKSDDTEPHRKDVIKDSNCNVITDLIDKYDDENSQKSSSENSNSSSASSSDSDSSKALKFEDHSLEDDISYKRIYAELESQFGTSDEPEEEKPKIKKQEKDYKYRVGKKLYYKSQKRTRDSADGDNYNKHSGQSIKTKGAQKYIPPTADDLKCHLLLPDDKLRSLKHPPVSGSTRMSVNRMTLPKKPNKPKFEDVLRSIDKTIMKKIKQTKAPKKLVVPKMVIKKNEQGAHYTASSRTCDDVDEDDDRQYRHRSHHRSDDAWQPHVCIERSASIEDLIRSDSSPYTQSGCVS